MNPWLIGNLPLTASVATSPSLALSGMIMSLSSWSMATSLHAFYTSLKLQWANKHMPLHMLNHIVDPLAPCDIRTKTLVCIDFS